MSDVATQIRHAVEALSTNSQNQGRRLRELLDESPAVFQQVVAAMLASARDTPELRYVIALLSARGMLVPMVRDLSSTDRGAAGVVAQLALRIDPRFERNMIRQTPETKPQGAPPRPDPEFLLGLLDSLSGGLCLLPLLAPLRESHDPRIRARMALLLGRITCAQDWFQALQEDADPRVRANVVESLWSVGGALSLACFQRALEDCHHRVVANSLVGLYLNGETSAVRGLVQMSAHHNANFRSAATWAMGRTGDTRFLDLLRQMRRGPGQDALVIRNALHAIGRIDQATLAAARRETQVICLQRGTRLRASMDVKVVVLNKDSGPLPILKPTDWQIRADGQPVWSYQAGYISPAAQLALGVAIPTSPAEDTSRMPRINEALGAVAGWRRAQDRFAALQYAESAGSHFEDALQSDPASARAADNRAAHPIEALSQLVGLLEASAGDLHLILVLDAIAETRCDLTELATLRYTLLHRGIRLHAISTRRAAPSLAAAFGQLSLDTGGFSLHGSDIEDLASALKSLIASAFGYFHLQCPLPEIVDQVEIHLQAERHQGTLPMAAVDMSHPSRVAA